MAVSGSSLANSLMRESTTGGGGLGGGGIGGITGGGGGGNVGGYRQGSVSVTEKGDFRQQFQQQELFGILLLCLLFWLSKQLFCVFKNN
uniref:Uncharacterized protein n=1 Tax=Meloidogyne enterolobii TaxID=390850 RepID=A0A6V7WAG4_MELEN|nr:unnamed protein product [Meloidogyne enterolobii]CAD2184069.1 unnamed protein product [Meloidogyne enterolobii]